MKVGERIHVGDTADYSIFADFFDGVIEVLFVGDEEEFTEGLGRGGRRWSNEVPKLGFFDALEKRG